MKECSVRRGGLDQSRKICFRATLANTRYSLTPMCLCWRQQRWRSVNSHLFGDMTRQSEESTTGFIKRTGMGDLGTCAAASRKQKAERSARLHDRCLSALSFVLFVF